MKKEPEIGNGEVSCGREAGTQEHLWVGSWRELKTPAQDPQHSSGPGEGSGQMHRLHSRVSVSSMMGRERERVDRHISEQTLIFFTLNLQGKGFFYPCFIIASLVGGVLCKGCFLPPKMPFLSASLQTGARHDGNARQPGHTWSGPGLQPGAAKWLSQRRAPWQERANWTWFTHGSVWTYWSRILSKPALGPASAKVLATLP